MSVLDTNRPIHSFSVAPMMDWTDRHCRYFHRLLAPNAMLYTEMVTTGALLHGDRERHLAFDPAESPLALQLGGSDPDDLARCAEIAQDWGYDEVNLNVGCPSDRVQRGRFGACLMLEPELVRECIASMIDAVDIPVTVKTRLGVDDCYSYGYFSGFVERVSESGCSHFIVHARKAWLSGLSPKENREVPELRYEWVEQLKSERPDLTIVLNGGIRTVEACESHLAWADGVMLGRAAYHDPWILACLQAQLFGNSNPASRETVIGPMTRYLQKHVKSGRPVKHVTRHVLGLFQGQPGARKWRRYLSEHAHKEDTNSEILRDALAAMGLTARGQGEENSASVHPAALE